MTIELDKLPFGANDTSSPAEDFDIASYRAGLLCGLETAAQCADNMSGYIGWRVADAIRKIKDEEILAGGTK